MKKYFRMYVMAGLLVFQLPMKAQEQTSYNLADIPVFLGAHFLLHVALSAAHQLGPIIVAKIFTACGAEFFENQETSNTYLMLNGAGTEVSVPEFKNGLANAIMYGSAPIAGLIGCYLALKSENIITEYTQSGRWKEAVYKGLKKSALNADQPRTFQALILAHIACNAYDFVPQYCTFSDGKLGGSTGAKVKYAVAEYMQNAFLQTIKI